MNAINYSCCRLATMESMVSFCSSFFSHSTRNCTPLTTICTSSTSLKPNRSSLLMSKVPSVEAVSTPPVEVSLRVLKQVQVQMLLQLILRVNMSSQVLLKVKLPTVEVSFENDCWSFYWELKLSFVNSWHVIISFWNVDLSRYFLLEIEIS